MTKLDSSTRVALAALLHDVGKLAEMRRIEAVIVERESLFLEKWHEHLPH